MGWVILGGRATELEFEVNGTNPGYVFGRVRVGSRKHGIPDQ